MNELITLVVIVIIFLFFILRSLMFIAKRDDIPASQLATTSIILVMGILAVMGTIYIQKGVNDAALLVSPIILALALVNLQDFFSYKKSKQLDDIHKSLISETSPESKQVEVNENLIREIKELKSDIKKLNALIENQNKARITIIEKNHSLINYSPRFKRKK